MLKYHIVGGKECVCLDFQLYELDNFVNLFHEKSFS